jgi:fluoride exporter
MGGFFWVFIGGGFGSALRYGIATLLNTPSKSAFPLATLISNFFSCLILGALVIYFNSASTAKPELKLFLIVGLCGGFSTFSTFSLETLTLFRSGNLSYAFINILISFFSCLGILYLITKNNPY